ncbi:hypothetical protein AXF42_Ash014852 [Apostasia shenzhenica]|uniref:Uncharacterized protein n=1 Tax=Apostasia shenzhenica TaxID=1088818 RepID=A0A2I0ALB1_9ASPA|nr:hypothetical protein AXF42_Ash014852 [Apostasia shenzhenica]
MEEVTKGKKEVPLQVAPEAALGIEGLGGKMEEVIKENERVPPAASNVAPSTGRKVARDKERGGEDPGEHLQGSGGSKISEGQGGRGGSPSSEDRGALYCKSQSVPKVITGRS